MRHTKYPEDSVSESDFKVIKLIKLLKNLVVNVDILIYRFSSDLIKIFWV